MRKVISSINMTLDGFCDHTAGIADDELHEDAIALLNNADTLIFGRITYQLMESAWPQLVKEPSGNKATDDFAVTIDNIDKVVFSRTLQGVTWKNSRLATGNILEVVSHLKGQPGKNIVVGSPSMIIELMNLNLIDEYQFWVQPVVLGRGLPLFKNVHQKVDLRLIKTKVLQSGVVTVTYERMLNYNRQEQYPVMV